MFQTIKVTGVQVNVLQVDKRPRVLDLFCGTGSWDGPFRKLGWEVHTLDINPKFQPTICCDLLDWDFEKFKPGHFEVIVASPPCQLFSHANQHKPDGLHIGDCLVLQTLRIIKHLRPKVWLLENPRMGDLARRAYMQHIPHAFLASTGDGCRVNSMC